MIYPTNNHIVVADVKQDTQTESGIILSTPVETGVLPVIVIASGPDSEYEQGTKVIVRREKCVPVTVLGKPCSIVPDTEVLAVVD
jgi:co-chaperonin GroES (HSP10)